MSSYWPKCRQNLKLARSLYILQSQFMTFNNRLSLHSFLFVVLIIYMCNLWAGMCTSRYKVQNINTKYKQGSYFQILGSYCSACQGHVPSAQGTKPLQCLLNGQTDRYTEHKTLCVKRTSADRHPLFMNQNTSSIYKCCMKRLPMTYVVQL